MTNPQTISAIVGKLSEAQARAILAFPEARGVEIGDEIVFPRQWKKASELGVSGNTLLSLQTFGGVDPKTLEGGPCLTMDDWSREGRHWALTDIGLAIRTALLTKGEGE